jgi:hypothetical protein
MVKVRSHVFFTSHVIATPILLYLNTNYTLNIFEYFRLYINNLHIHLSDYDGHFNFSQMIKGRI